MSASTLTPPVSPVSAAIATGLSPLIRRRIEVARLPFFYEAVVVGDLDKDARGYPPVVE